MKLEEVEEMEKLEAGVELERLMEGEKGEKLEQVVLEEVQKVTRSFRSLWASFTMSPISRQVGSGTTITWRLRSSRRSRGPEEEQVERENLIVQLWWVPVALLGTGSWFWSS